MEGWRPVEDLVRWGFAHAPVVMANEAHNGLARCVRTREVGVRMIRAAHEAGVRRLAMEALPHRPGDTQGPILAVPPDTEGYLAQPEMRRLIGTALDLGWTLWAYEAVIDITPDTDQDHLRSMEFTNWREREQAANLCRSAGRGPRRAAAGLVRQRPRHQGEVPRIGSRWAGTSARCPASTRSSSTRP